MSLGRVLKKMRDEEAHAYALNQISVINYKTNTNGAERTVDSITETTIVSATIEISRYGIILIHFSGQLNVAAACTITAQCYLDASPIMHQAKLYASAAGYYHLNWTPYILDVKPGEHTVSIKAQTSASSLTVGINQAHLILEARGLTATGTDLFPEIEASLTVMAMPSAPVAVLDVTTVAAVTIDEAETVMAMPSAPTESFLIIYERYQSGDDAALDIYGNTWEGQSFTTQVAHTVDTVMALLYRVGSPGTVTAEIYATDAGGLPTGAVLASGTTDGDTLTTATAGEKRYVSLGAGTALSISTKYALVIRASTGDASNKAVWRNDGSSPTYANGARVNSADAGSSWAEDTTRDFLFEEGDQI